MKNVPPDVPPAPPVAQGHAFKCPVCGRPVPAGRDKPATFPFCRDRCRLVDLGRWLDGDYQIEQDADDPDAGAGESGRDR